MPSATTTSSTATTTAATAATTAVSTATAPATTAAPTASTTPAPTGGAAAPGDDGGADAEGPASAPAGDEAGTRVPAFLAVFGTGVSPGRVMVPPFLRIELRVSSGDGKSHRVLVHTPTPVTVMVPASGSVAHLIDGVRAGTYAIDVDDRTGVGALVAADAAGP